MKKHKRYHGYMPVIVRDNSCVWCPALKKSSVDNHLYCSNTGEVLMYYDEQRGDDCPLEDVREMGGDEV